MTGVQTYRQVVDRRRQLRPVVTTPAPQDSFPYHGYEIFSLSLLMCASPTARIRSWHDHSLKHRSIAYSNPLSQDFNMNLCRAATLHSLHASHALASPGMRSAVKLRTLPMPLSSQRYSYSSGSRLNLSSHDRMMSDAYQTLTTLHRR